MKGLIRIFEEIEFKDKLIIKGDNCHYLKNVRRVEVNSFIVIMNYKKIAKYQIENIDKKSICLKLIELFDVIKPDYDLVLYQSVLKREFMDNVVEKAGEIGVTRFVPVITQRSINKLKENTFKRYKQLIINGAMQAEHSFIPEISEPIYLEDIKVDTEEFYIFYERKEKKDFLNFKSKSISIFIGPEGGISEEELLLLENKGGHIVSPLSSILKAETASILFVGMSKIMLENKFGI